MRKLALILSALIIGSTFKAMAECTITGAANDPTVIEILKSRGYKIVPPKNADYIYSEATMYGMNRRDLEPREFYGKHYNPGKGFHFQQIIIEIRDLTGAVVSSGVSKIFRRPNVSEYSYQAGFPYNLPIRDGFGPFGENLKVVRDEVFYFPKVRRAWKHTREKLEACPEL